jgi:hypothetical protein
VITWDPRSTEGLVAETKISRTELGDETLTLADDGALDASLAFLAAPSMCRWEGRTKRTVLKAFAEHLGFTPDPSYTGARVLAVRDRAGALTDVAAPIVVATPNLDAVRAELAADRYRRLG